MTVTLVIPIAIAAMIWRYSHYKQGEIDRVIQKLEETDSAATKLAVLKTYDKLFLLYESLRIVLYTGQNLESSRAITNQSLRILGMLDNDITTCAKSIDSESIQLLTITLSHVHTILIRISGPETTLNDLKVDIVDLKKIMPTIKDIFEKDFDPLIPDDNKFTIPDVR